MRAGGKPSRLLGWSVSRPVSLAALLLLTLLVVLLCYHFTRTLSVNVGVLGDTAFLSPGGFHADELDIGYRYRWTRGHSEVYFPGAGSAAAVNVDVQAQGPRPEDSEQPITMSVSLNGMPLPRYEDPSPPAPITLTSEMAFYEFDTGAARRDAPHVVTIDTTTFRPPGDARNLGAKVDFVVLWQSTDGLNLPPLWMVLWPLVLVGGVYGALIRLRPALSLAPALLVVALFGLLLLLRPLYVAGYLPPVAAALGVLGLVVWQWERVRRWPEWVDALSKRQVSGWVMVGAMLAYALVVLWVLPHVDWIGHADYAENAVIARNLVSGKGFTVDYIAQFYKEHGPGISHPADTWPLLQPLMIAPFFALFGPLTWAAKLPNLLVLLGLAWAVFALSSRLWDPRVGLFAGLLTLVHTYFFNAVLYPINDLGFTLIFFLLAWSVWRGLAPLTAASRLPTWSALGVSFTRRQLIVIGVLAGLLVWSKPSGAILLLGVGLWAFWVWVRHRQERSFPWKAVLVVGAAAGLVLLPLVVRNLLAFGMPFFTTESYDAWILRYWPLHDWEDIYKFYIGSPDPPHPRWVVGGKFGYENLVDAVLLSFRWVWQKGVLGSPGEGDYVVGLLPLAGALVGLGAATSRVRSIFALAGLSTGLYALFVLLYWHYEGRYFQVMVPWAYMLLAFGVFWVWDRLRNAEHPAGAPAGESRSLAAALFLPVAVAGLIWPSVSAVYQQMQSDTARTGFVTGMEWLKANSAPQDVIMTRDPWELNWYVERKAVMIPNDDLSTIEETMRKYGVTMLQLGGPVDGISVRDCPNAVGSRPALDGLYCGQERPGYELVYREGGLTIYRLSGR